MKKLAKSLWKILIIAVFVNFTACIKIENSKPEIYKPYIIIPSLSDCSQDLPPGIPD
mgnify:CR=1 FL=1